MNIERIEKRRRNRFIILIRGIVISVTFKCTKSRIKLPNKFIAILTICSGKIKYPVHKNGVYFVVTKYLIKMYKLDNYH